MMLRFCDTEPGATGSLIGGSPSLSGVTRDARQSTEPHSCRPARDTMQSARFLAVRGAASLVTRRGQPVSFNERPFPAVISGGPTDDAFVRSGNRRAPRAH